MSSPKIHVHFRRGKVPTYTKRALAWIRCAERDGFDALILVIDQDGDGQRERQFESAQEDIRFTFSRALGVAIRTFDAWMLADERALTVALGCTVSRQEASESIVDPKSVCKALRDAGTQAIRLRDMYASVADAADIETLVARCPRGFAPFARRVRAL